MKLLEGQGYNVTDTASVKSEPCTIPYGSGRSYTPDFLLCDTRTLVEVKPSYACTLDTNIAKFEAAKCYCKANGMQFRVVTEKDIPRIEFDQANLDPDLKWNEATLEYFRK
jgi:hypothetical protein